jgi:hypothetical protein
VVDEQGKTAEQRLREIEEMLTAMEQATIQPLYEKQ